jgi:hypothetical protein
MPAHRPATWNEVCFDPLDEEYPAAAGVEKSRLGGVDHVTKL